MIMSIVNAGYVGVVVAVCVAKLGNKVTLVDIGQSELNQISRGVSWYH